jgi:hypothetical protein
VDGKDPRVVQAIATEHVVADNLGGERREKSAGKLVPEVHAVPALDGTGPEEVGTERREGNRKRMPAEQLAPRHTGTRSHELEEPAAHYTEVQEEGDTDGIQLVELTDTLGEAQQVELLDTWGEAQMVELAETLGDVRR